MNMQAIIPAPVEAPTMAERTMLVSFNARQWGAQRLDRKATRDVLDAAGAKSSAGRFNKYLVDPKHLAGVAKVVGAARAEHATYTLPWLSDGTRILPADAFVIYSAKMQAHREEFEIEVDKFLALYPDLVGEAILDLGRLFRADEYPGVASIRCKFGWSIDVLPMPDASDFRVDLGDDQVRRIKARIEESTRAAMQAGMADAWSRLHGVVAKMVDKLKGYVPADGSDKAGGVFRDSLVDNIRALVEVLPLLNIAGDAKLAEMIDRARNDLCDHSATELREDHGAREDVARAAESIMADMESFMG